MEEVKFGISRDAIQEILMHLDQCANPMVTYTADPVEIMKSALAYVQERAKYSASILREQIGEVPKRQ